LEVWSLAALRLNNGLYGGGPPPPRLEYASSDNRSSDLHKSSLPFSNVLVSSGVLVLLTSILLNVHQSSKELADLRKQDFAFSTFTVERIVALSQGIHNKRRLDSSCVCHPWRAHTKVAWCGRPDLNRRLEMCFVGVWVRWCGCTFRRSHRCQDVAQSR